MPDVDNNFGGSLGLDFRKWWRHVQPKNYPGTYSRFSRDVTAAILVSQECRDLNGWQMMGGYSAKHDKSNFQEKFITENRNKCLTKIIW